MPPETRKLITFANYSNPSSSFVNIKVAVYTGIIPCFIPPNDNPKLKQTFAQYGVNTPRLSRSFLEATDVKEFIAWMQRTSNVLFLTMMLSTAVLWVKNDISYGGHFCRMGNPVTVKA